MADLKRGISSLNFSDDNRRFLYEVLQRAKRPPPDSWRRWRMDDDPNYLGWMSKDRLALFSAALPRSSPLQPVGDEYVWQASRLDAAERSAVLESIAIVLRDSGLIRGWRDEQYACWRQHDFGWPYPEPALFRLERAAFRFFGLRSHAAHVHGLTSDGRMWCGRRALSKEIDPGRFDNLAAGGVPAGEDPEQCAARELLEEAGLHRSPDSLLGPRREVLTERCEAEGWHSERLFVFSTVVSADERPENLDGEVDVFTALEGAAVINMIQNGLFTEDAACAIAATFSR